VEWNRGFRTGRAMTMALPEAAPPLLDTVGFTSII